MIHYGIGGSTTFCNETGKFEETSSCYSIWKGNSKHTVKLRTANRWFMYALWEDVGLWKATIFNRVTGSKISTQSIAWLSKPDEDQLMATIKSTRHMPLLDKRKIPLVITHTTIKSDVWALNYKRGGTRPTTTDENLRSVYGLIQTDNIELYHFSRSFQAKQAIENSIDAARLPKGKDEVVVSAAWNSAFIEPLCYMSNPLWYKYCLPSLIEIN